MWYMVWFEPMESMKWQKFIVLFFCCICNEKWRSCTSIRSISTFTLPLPPPHPPNSEPSYHFCCHFQILCHQRLFIFPWIRPADLNQCNWFFNAIWSGICPNWSNRGVILASHKITYTFLTAWNSNGNACRICLNRGLLWNIFQILKNSFNAPLKAV